MKGTVEIYSNYGSPEQEIVHKESNLIVDGAGEAICSMLTTPSSVVSGVSKMTDASNFTVQAISFGKASKAYKIHAHYYPFNFKDHLTSDSEYHGYVNLVKKDHVIRAKSFVNENAASTLYSFDPVRDPGVTPKPSDTKLEPDSNTALDAVSGQYYQSGPNLVQGRSCAVGHNLNKLASPVNPNLISYTRSPADDPGWPSSPVHWKYNVLNNAVAPLSSIHSGPFYGTSAILLQKNIVGAGNVRQEFPNNQVYMHPNVDHTFSMYLKHPPSNAVSAFELNLFKETATPAVSKSHKALFIWDEGEEPRIESVSGANGVVPFITQVDGINPGWYRFGVMLSGIGEGPPAFASVSGSLRANLVLKATGTNNAQLFTWGWQVEERFGASKFHEVSGSSPSFEEGGLAGNSFLGCWPEASGTEFAIVSSIENLNIDADGQAVFVSGIYPHHPDVDYFFNSSSVRSMDQNGFVRAYNANLGEISNPTSGVIVSSFHGLDASCRGEVVYVCTISSGDLGLANMYGGLFKAGLWTIDLEKTLSGENPYGYEYTGDLSGAAPVCQPPFRFSAGSNRIVYKLFAEKNFTKNLAKIKDDSADTPKYGCFQYDPLTIVWRIKFI